MRTSKLVSVTLFILVLALAGLVVYEKSQSRVIAIPILQADGTLGAKMVKLPASMNLLASTLVKIGGGTGSRDVRYSTQAETQNGQALIHGPTAPDDLHLTDCAPSAPLSASEVFQGLGAGNANAWGYRYKDRNAAFETNCVQVALNATPPQAIDSCFLGANAGKFIGQADGFSFVDPSGTLDVPAGEPFALFVASMNVVAPETQRLERCTKSTTPVCGDRFIDSPENCDDGNAVSGDGCSSTCQTTTVCNDGSDSDGDSFVDCADPGCHSDSNAANAGTCVTGGTSEEHTDACGNGALESGEACDDGNTSNFDVCLATCVTNIVGDGFPLRTAPAAEPGDPCDDGNVVSEDGCSSTGVTETRYVCQWNDSLSKDECKIPLGGLPL